MLARARATVLFTAVISACAEPSTTSAPPHDSPEIATETVTSALTDADPVSAAVNDACTTSVVKGLSTQLIDEIQCMKPGTFGSLEGAPGLKLGSAVFPWLQAPARDALLAVQKERGGVDMDINSALRTLPQQLLLYRWYQAKRCGIGLAAKPGSSNHESALAVDIDDNAAWRTAMANHNFKWLGAGDPVHFDYTGPGIVDIGGLSVLAFQRLWNRNHPEDRIEEDSEYGGATEERLLKSPVGGFPNGAECKGGGSAPTPSGDGGTTSGSLGANGKRSSSDESGCVVSSSNKSNDGAALFPFVVLTLLGMIRSRGRSGRRDSDTCAR